jgi:hypothetical protein
VTGSAFEVHDILAPHAAQVLVSNPVATRRLGSARHTDREDAVRLAQMLASGTVPAVWVPPHPVRGVRWLLEVRERLCSYRRALTNQARAVLSRHSMLLAKGMLCTAEIYRGTQQATLRRKEAELTKLLQQVPRWEEKLLNLLEAMGDSHVARRCKADAVRGQIPSKQPCPAAS